MEQILQLLLSGPMAIVIPVIVTLGLLWVIYYFVFPILEKNDKLLEENEKLNEIVINEIKNIKEQVKVILDSISNNKYNELLEEIEEEIKLTTNNYPKLKEEIIKIISKLNEIKEHIISSRRNIDTTSQIISILKNLEIIERSIELVKERQLTHHNIIYSKLSKNKSDDHGEQ